LDREIKLLLVVVVFFLIKKKKGMIYTWAETGVNVTEE